MLRVVFRMFSLVLGQPKTLLGIAVTAYSYGDDEALSADSMGLRCASKVLAD